MPRIPNVRKFLHNNPGYLPMFVVGVLASLPYSIGEIQASLETVGVLMLAALFASLLLAFAGLSREEATNKWILQNAPLAAFGAYTMQVAKQPTMVAAVLLLCAMAMHISYWNSSFHSRQYRLEQYRLGFASEMPATSRLIACLNGTGCSELGDILVQGVLSQTGVPEEFWNSIPNNLNHLGVMAKLEYVQGLSSTKGKIAAVS